MGMVVIRLARAGAKKRPFYHIVATDKHAPRDGRFIERLGYFNPVARGADKRLHMDVERVNYWVSVGAQRSDRVVSLMKEFQLTPEENEKILAKKAEKREKAKQAAAKAAEPAAEDEAQAATGT